jgi:hypothetical protein
VNSMRKPKELGDKRIIHHGSHMKSLCGEKPASNHLSYGTTNNGSSTVFRELHENNNNTVPIAQGTQNRKRRLRQNFVAAGTSLPTCSLAIIKE